MDESKLNLKKLKPNNKHIPSAFKLVEWLRNRCIIFFIWLLGKLKINNCEHWQDLISLKNTNKIIFQIWSLKYSWKNKNRWCLYWSLNCISLKKHQTTRRWELWFFWVWYSSHFYWKLRLRSRGQDIKCWVKKLWTTKEISPLYQLQ